MSDFHSNPMGDKLALDALGATPGWALYVKRFDDLLSREIDAKIFDTATSAEERLALCHARKALTGSYTPEKMRQSMIAALQTEITRAGR